MDILTNSKFVDFEPSMNAMLIKMYTLLFVRYTLGTDPSVTQFSTLYYDYLFMLLVFTRW